MCETVDVEKPNPGKDGIIISYKIYLFKTSVVHVGIKS